MEARRFDNRYSMIPGLLLNYSRLMHFILATCPKCDNGRAYFYQLQIRSADEPMTTCMSFLSPHFCHFLTLLNSISLSVRPSCYSIAYLPQLPKGARHVPTNGEKTSQSTFLPRSAYEHTLQGGLIFLSAQDVAVLESLHRQLPRGPNGLAVLWADHLPREDY